MPQLGFVGTVSGTETGLLERLDQVVTNLGFTAYTETTKSRLDVFCITAALMFGTAGLPHVIIRFFTVSSARAARKSAGWALMFIALLYTVAPAVGAFARYNFVETVNEATYIADAEDYEARAAEIRAAGGKPVPAWYKGLGSDRIAGVRRRQRGRHHAVPRAERAGRPGKRGSSRTATSSCSPIRRSRNCPLGSSAWSWRAGLAAGAVHGGGPADGDQLRDQPRFAEAHLPPRHERAGGKWRPRASPPPSPLSRPG